MTEKETTKPAEDVAETATEKPQPNLPSTQQTGQQTGKAAVYGQEAMSEEVGNLDAALQAMRDIQAANDENISADEIRVSRLVIAQTGTPQVAAKEEGWEAGMLFDSMMKEPISIKAKAPWLLAKGVAADELKPRLFTPFLAIFKLPTEYVKWPTKEEKANGIKRFHWKLLDAADPDVRAGLWPPKGTWKGTGSPPVTETLNVLGMCLDINGNPTSSLIIASFSRTSYPTGTKFISALNSHRLSNMPWWGRIYYLFTDVHKKVVEGQQTTFYVLDFAKGEKLLEFCKKHEANGADGDALFKQCFRIAQQLADKNTGKELQYRYLSLAEFDEETSEESGDPALDDAATADPEFSTGGF